MRSPLNNINCVFSRKMTILKLLQKPRSGDFSLNIRVCTRAVNVKFQSNKSIGSRSKFLRLRRVGQLLERLIKVGLIV